MYCDSTPKIWWLVLIYNLIQSIALPKLLLLLNSTCFCVGELGWFGFSVRTTFDDDDDDDLYSSCRVPLLVIISVGWAKQNKLKTMKIFLVMVEF